MAMRSESNSEMEARFSFISIIQPCLLLPRAEPFAYSSMKISLEEYSRYVSMCVICVCLCAVHLSLIFSKLTSPPVGWRKTQESLKELNGVCWTNTKIPKNEEISCVKIPRRVFIPKIVEFLYFLVSSNAVHVWYM